LFVGKDQEKGISEFILVEHSLQLFTGLDNTVTIIAIDDEDDALGILEVMSPKRSDLVLASNVPDGELDVLVFDSLNIEAYGFCMISRVTPDGNLGARPRLTNRLWGWL
jgi:hypothetical protein